MPNAFRLNNIEEGAITSEPLVVPAAGERGTDKTPIVANGQSFSIQEWQGSGPSYLHVHYADDEAWHVLEGTLTFTFADRKVEAAAGTTVFVPAGVAHTYEADDAARYLIVLTPRLRDLIEALHAAPQQQHAAIMHSYQSEVLE